MSCTRCGQSRISRPAPTIVQRPGGVTVPAQRPTPIPANIIRDSITGLRYIPNNVGK